MYGNILQSEQRKSGDSLRVISSNVNIGDLRLIFSNCSFGGIDVYELLYQAEYFPSKFGQSVSEDSLYVNKSVW